MSKTRSIQKCDYCGGRGTTKDVLNICPECDGCGYNHVLLLKGDGGTTMGELLYNKWLDEEIEDLPKALLLYGVVGILDEFKTWLKRNGYIKDGK